MNALLAILNVFIDPAETVRRTTGQTLGWLPPVILGGLIMAFYSYAIGPLTMQAMRNDLPPGLDAAKLNESMGAMQITARISATTAPVIYAITAILSSGLVFAGCVLLSVNVRFPDLFNLVAHVGVIGALEKLAHYFVLIGKGELMSRKELLPGFGLEMFLSDGAPKMLYGLLTYFSFFTVWQIAVLGIGLAALGQSEKSKAFLATAPRWLIGALFAMVQALLL